MDRNLELRQAQEADQQMQSRRSGVRSTRNHGPGPYERVRGSSRPTAVARMVQSEVEASSPIPSVGSRASFLDTPGGTVEISGGQFNATAGHHINVTINTAAVGGTQSDTGNLGSTPRLVHDENTGTTEIVNLGSDLIMQPPTPSVHRSCDIYYRHMGAQGRGSPLWIPGPNKNLPIQYQRQGIGIGDVGILTAFGGFAFLFNICLHHDHPLQSADLPENFTPFFISQVDIEKQSEFLTDSHLASASIERSRRDGDSSGLVFESSASEGAILTMPLGSTSEDLGNVIRLRRYVAANVASWYRYVYEIRGREITNGDLRLVIGYDKSRAWGMATFSNSTAHKDKAFRLKFRPLEQTDVGRTYGWEYSGLAQVRAGPDRQEIEALRMGDPLEEGLEYENQSLFVRTMNADLPDKIWKELASELNVLVDSHNSDLFTSPSTQGFAGTGIGNTSSPPTCTPSTYSESRGTSRTADGDMPPYPARTVHVRPAAMAGHPSKAINKMLRENAKKDLRMIITEDKDWISVLTKDDFVLPSEEELCSRVQASSVIREEEGIIYLEPKEIQLTEHSVQKTSLKSAAPEFEVNFSATPSQQHKRGREREKSITQDEQAEGGRSQKNSSAHSASLTTPTLVDRTDLRKPQSSPVITSMRQEGPEIWGQWAGRRHYSLQVVQHPLRGRMCGFADKDRKSLSPAAVVKMVVRREDESVIDVDEVDCSFFLVTVDLWSADGKHEMNLVLHPSTADRYVPSHVPSKTGRRSPSTSPPVSRQSGSQTLAGHSTTIPSQYRTGDQLGKSTPSLSADAALEDQTYLTHQAPFSDNINHSQVNHNVDPAFLTPSSNVEIPEAGWNVYGHAPFPEGQRAPYAQSPQLASGPIGPSDPAIGASLPRHTYSRSLIGPLSANARRLLDERRKPGIFFIFQDLSVRTEGTFRLRMRLMNVGAPPAPEIGEQRVHKDVSPVLAQVFTEQFTVFSAKRFPGVPDTTALSIAFGNQGEKLPLLNRHRRRRRGESGSDEDSEEA